MGVLAVVAVEVQGEAPVLGEGTEELGEKLGVEGPYPLWHGTEVAGEVTAAPEIHDGTRERLYERRASRWRRWSKNPSPVETSALPEPSSSSSTLTEVSPVSRSVAPLRAIALPAVSF